MYCSIFSLLLDWYDINNCRLLLPLLNWSRHFEQLKMATTRSDAQALFLSTIYRWFCCVLVKNDTTPSGYAAVTSLTQLWRHSPVQVLICAFKDIIVHGSFFVVRLQNLGLSHQVGKLTECDLFVSCNKQTDTSSSIFWDRPDTCKTNWTNNCLHVR